MSTVAHVYIIHTCHGEPIGLIAKDSVDLAMMALANSGWPSCERSQVHRNLIDHEAEITVRDYIDSATPGSVAAGTCSSRVRLGPDIYAILEWKQ